jgi:predicted nucleotidyltransferase
MNLIDDASLEPRERRVIERLVESLEHEFGPDLRSIWLYGSRARGEAPRNESDVDLIVVATRVDPDDQLRAIRLGVEIALEEGANPALFSIKLFAPEYVKQRRQIRSFFMQEVDRDKIVLTGSE